MNIKSNPSVHCWACLREWPIKGTSWHLFLYHHPVFHRQESICWTAVITSHIGWALYSPLETIAKRQREVELLRTPLNVIVWRNRTHVKNLVKHPYVLLEVAIKQILCNCITSLKSKILPALRCPSVHHFNVHFPLEWWPLSWFLSESISLLFYVVTSLDLWTDHTCSFDCPLEFHTDGIILHVFFVSLSSLNISWKIPLCVYFLFWKWTNMRRWEDFMTTF